MKLHGTNPRWLRDFWAHQHREAAATIRKSVRKSGDTTTPRYGRKVRRHDLNSLKQMRGKRRAMGVQ